MRNVPFSVILFLLAFIPSQTTHALTNGVALTPPMGWNSWYDNGSGISEQVIKNAADAMATNGMKAAGYEYICMDDGWAGYRDTNGVMVADPVKFPSGIKALADYIHAKGFKFGIYTVFGEYTCANLPGSFGHVVQDANTYAAWGIDLVKYEGCSFPDPLGHEQEQCELMGNALLATGRPIVYAMSTGPALAWMPSELNMFRGTGDNRHTFESMMLHLDYVAQTPELAGPGHWNDPDVLESGRFSRSALMVNMSMWCIVAAPLLSEGSGSPSYLDILTNREVIAVDQDPAGIQGVCVATNGDLQVWCKPMGSNGTTKAVALLNRGATTADITANWAALGLPAGFATVRDLWATAYTGNFTNAFTASVPGYSVQLVSIVPGARVPLPPAGTNYLSDWHWLSTMSNPYPIPSDKDTGGNPIKLHGVTYPKGLGAHAPSHIEYLLQRTATRFRCDVGVDDDACCNRASIIFQVWADGVKLYDSGVMTSASPTQSIDVDLTGRTTLTLDVTDAGDGNTSDHADWAGARIVVAPVPIEFTPYIDATGISLAWDAPSGATNYTIKRSTTSGGPYQDLASTTLKTYQDTNALPDTLYYYVVSAAYPSGITGSSTQASAILSPTWINTLTASAQNWNASSNWINTAVFPNQSGRTVIINADIASNQTINLNQAIALGSLSIGDPNGSGAYTIAANGGTFVFDNGAGVASLTQMPTSKGDIIAAPISLLSDLTIQNTSFKPLTLSGAIAGTRALTQTGAGVLALNGANTFTGLVTVAQGTLKAGNASALGTTAGGTILAGGATLDVNGFNLGAERVMVAGVGVGGNGAIINNGPAQLNALQSITLAGNAALGGANRWDLRATNVAVPTGILGAGGNAYKLTKISSNQISLAGISVDPALGDIEVQAGILGVESATTSLGNPTNTLTVFSGASLQLASLTNKLNKQIVLNGDGTTSTLINASGSNTIVGPLTLNGTCILDVAGTALALAGPIGGSGGFTKISGSPLYLYGTNSYAGDTVINAGTLALAGSGSIPSSHTIALAPGTLLDVSGRTNANLSFASGQTLTGNGSVKGGVTMGNGATLLPGNSLGTLSFNNALTLANGSRCVIGISKSPLTNGLVQASGTLTYGGSLVLTNFAPATLAAGDRFKLFDAGSYSGAFTSIVPQIPAPGLLWDTSDLTNSGTLWVIAGTLPRFNASRSTLNNVVMSGTGGTVGRPGDPYYILASTNAELPLFQWTPVATNQFDASGNFAFTNAADPLTPRKFYTLQFAGAFPHVGVLNLTLNPAMVSGTGGTSNGTYYLLGSTNPALGQWTRIATNQFDASGHFAFTNALDPHGPGRFYRLQLP